MKNMKRLSVIGCCLLLTLTGCSKSEEIKESVIKETTNQFAVNEDINVNDNQNNTIIESQDSFNIDNEKNNGNFDNSDAVSNMPEGIIEESKKAELDESVAEQESLAYEESLNSDERVEVYMTYDRTEGDNLIVYYMNDSERKECRIRISEVTEGIDELKQGDSVCILCNGVFTEDGSEFVKVYKVINVTQQEESLMADDEEEFERLELEENH